MQPSIQPDEDLYAVLGLSPSASAAEVKCAWRHLAAQCHPDMVLDNTCSTENFLRIQRAYSVLGNPVAREHYDESLSERSVVPLLGLGLPAHRGSRQFGNLNLFCIQLGRALVTCVRHFQRRPGGYFLAHYLEWLPWGALVRIRTLGLAFAVGLLTVNWHLGVSEQRIVPAPSTLSMQFATTTALDATPAMPPAPFIRPDSRSVAAPARLASKLDSSTLASVDPPPAKSHGQPLFEGNTALLTEEQSGASPSQPLPNSSAAIQPEIKNFQPLANLPSEFAVRSSSRSTSRLENIQPDTSSAALKSWQGRWLAGCISPDGAQVFAGHLELFGTEASFLWRSWQQVGSSRQAGLAASVPLNFKVSLDAHSPEDRLLLASQHAFHPSHAFLLRSPGSFASLFIPDALASDSPCLEWHLASPQTASIAGRWLLPDHPAKDATDPFPLEHLEIRISPPTPQYSSHMVGRYGVRPANPRRLVNAATEILPTVEFGLDAAPGRFEGAFRLRGAKHSEGTLTVAPVGPSSLAIRWELHRLVPGKLQLKGGLAVLRRR